ncbi:branched-chain amino acid ABC transporter permease [Xanthobacter pseudotagetidis]|uniref:branched-chain amino acid ABC transporter permease n=1 Tax=Xanthobacter pseudotagetidis TaxID=3119911 RepID=UPI00372906FA
MSGYALQIGAILCVNVISAYAAYMTLAAGQLNLGIAGFMAVGAYASAVLSNAGWSMPHSIAGAVLLASLVGLCVSYPVLRARGIYLTIATLAFSEVVVALILNMESLGAASGLVVVGHLGFWPIFWVTAGVVALMVFLASTRFGLCLTAIRNDAQGAAVFGVRTRRIEVTAFTIGAAIAGLAGALYAHHFSYVEAQRFNVLLSTYAVLYTLLGGLQTPLGPLVGAALFTLAPELLRGTDEWRYVTFGAVIVVLMLLRSEGLFTRSFIHNLIHRRAAT